jgi:hypothetical protein
LYDVEKNAFQTTSTSDEFGNVIPNQVRSIPFPAVIYQLTQLFHCLPSEVMNEDNELINDILVMHNTYQEIEEAYRKQEETNKKAKINMKMSKHLVIGLELEKLKAK